MNKLHVKVTREDIIYGLPGRISSCPIARALKREFGTTQVAVVGSDNIRVAGRYFEGSAAVDRFIMAFDERRPVRATTFALTELDA